MYNLLLCMMKLSASIIIQIMCQLRTIGLLLGLKTSVFYLKFIFYKPFCYAILFKIELKFIFYCLILI